MASQQQQQRALLRGPCTRMNISEGAAFLRWRAKRHLELLRRWENKAFPTGDDSVDLASPEIDEPLMREQFRDLAWILFYEQGPNAHIECFESACKLCSHDTQVLDLIERTCRETFSGIGNWWA